MIQFLLDSLLRMWPILRIEMAQCENVFYHFANRFSRRSLISNIVDGISWFQKHKQTHFHADNVFISLENKMENVSDEIGGQFAIDIPPISCKPECCTIIRSLSCSPE